jgi:hypothetical protein
MNATDWTAFGSIGTAAAALIAVVAILVPLQAGRRQRDREQAARLRDAVKTFAASTERFITALLGGSALIGVAASVVDYVRQQLPESATVDDVWRFVGDPEHALRAAVVGLANAPDHSATSDQQVMLIAGQELVGGLDLLSSTGRLALKAAEDGSRRVFENLCAPEPLKLFRQDDKSTSVYELLLNLTSYLQSNSARYFTARYDDALQELNTLIQTAASALARLNAKRLLRAAGSKVGLEPSPTLTDDMRSGIGLLEKSHVLRVAEVKALTASVDRIEMLLAKQGAIDRAAELTSGRTE